MNYRHNEIHNYQQHLRATCVILQLQNSQFPTIQINVPATLEELILKLQNSQFSTIPINVLHNYTNTYHGAQIKKNLFVAMI